MKMKMKWRRRKRNGCSGYCLFRWSLSLLALLKTALDYYNYTQLTRWESEGG
jgi:hypothetical protein